MPEEQPAKQDPDGPPAYDDDSAPPDLRSHSKKPESQSESAHQHQLEAVESSSSGLSSSGFTSQPSILALDDNPPRYASLTIHSWKTLRFVNFPHSVLEAVDGIARQYYLKGIKWEFEHEQWSLITNAIACESQI